MSARRFKKSDWKKMRIVSTPTESHGQQRIDDQGRIWEWTGGLKYAETKRVK
jgi:hypothetical protein